LHPYVLIGDVAYSTRPWMFSPYKRHKDGLRSQEYHWNFIQSSSRNLGCAMKEPSDS
jgi:hypothetical protein